MSKKSVADAAKRILDVVNKGKDETPKKKRSPKKKSETVVKDVVPANKEAAPETEKAVSAPADNNGKEASFVAFCGKSTPSVSLTSRCSVLLRKRVRRMRPRLRLRTRVVRTSWGSGMVLVLQASTRFCVKVPRFRR
jgi:outer membrane biosynthesis protein TonB